MIDSTIFIFGEEPAAAKPVAPVAEQVQASVEKTKSSQIDLTSIQNMFLSAHNKGLKTPKYRADGLVLSMAPMTGRNPGAIYVKDADTYDYLGKVVKATFYPTRECKEHHKDALYAIAENPLEAAIKYGRLTGNCACCGRTLTDKNSVAAGIGPICAEKFGF